jgi:hypothetical protein
MIALYSAGITGYEGVLRYVHLTIIKRRANATLV